jgi:hypothetical protein
VRGTFQPRSDTPFSKGPSKDGKDTKDKSADAKDKAADAADKSATSKSKGSAKEAPAKTPVTLKPADEPSK